ncbi:hypothetical protein HPT27_09695 [Permianibacter sp. IMCC34836]|uniref:hypothetical protein n=1 Tax=Permianibacter fluminis TaxID=2738515 RepID=UPI001552F79D|nr:hypothetical protein [Permianibacter fluminis]NQD37300.1 hypothetical protein [Permianibacter fluminis]
MFALLWLTFGATAGAAELRDPTRPGWSPPDPNAAAQASKPVSNPLTAIVIGDHKRLALIGERYYQTGERVGDATLSAIAFDHVVLKSGTGQRILRLTPTLDSRTAAKVNGL